MKMEDPVPQFSHLVTEIKRKHPKLAYIHVVEPRILGYEVIEHPQYESNNFLREIWGNRPFIAAGGYDRALALEASEKRQSELIAFGRLYASNVSGIPCSHLTYSI
jgi:NADPH2 dehydrogenase